MLSFLQVGDGESAMHVYEEIKVLGLNSTVSTLNALVAALCMKSVFTTVNSNPMFDSHFRHFTLHSSSYGYEFSFDGLYCI